MEHSAVYPQQARQGQSLLQHCVLQPLVNIQVVTHGPLQVESTQILIDETAGYFYIQYNAIDKFRKSKQNQTYPNYYFF